MKAGIIGLPAEGALDDDDFEWTMFTERDEELDDELTTALAFEEVTELDGSTSYVEGAALQEDSETIPDYYVEDGTIRKGDALRKTQQYAEFVAATATDTHPGFIVVGSSSAADVVFDRVGDEFVDRAQISLGSFVQAHDSFSMSSAGTSNVQSDGVSSIMAWGDDVMSNPDVKDVVGSATVGNELNPLSGGYAREGARHRVMLSESGYVQVYEPDLDTHQFVEWVVEEVLPHTNAPEPPEDEDEAEQEEDDG